MNYLSAESISKSYGEKPLFQDLNFGISQGQKIALVGINGSGKSTLLNVLAGNIPPDSGSVSVRKGVKVGFLGQQPVFNESFTVQQTIFASGNQILDTIQEYERCLENPNTSAAKMQELIERMDALQAWEYELKIKQILSQLGIHNLDSQISTLSGGQRKRVAMARVLIDEPDLLILDEPTNHLDLDTIEWLEGLLASSQQTLLMVTHDRYFLDRVATEIAELERGNIYTYKGNYSYFVQKKDEREQQQDAEIEKARNLMRKELEWMRRQPQARGTKSKSRIEAFYDLKDKANSKVTKANLELSVKTTRQGGKIIEVEHISKAFGEKKILEDFSYTFKKKDRIGIIGKNGAGKTTFLNMLTGKIKPDSGVVETGETTVFGYYTQQELTFKEDQRVIDIVKDIAEVVETGNGETITAAQFLQHFQFSPAMQYTFVSKLSGGEKRRLQLLRVLIKNPNFLILDEPTNDLDIITLNILEDFLLNFGGCLLIVSHDRYFMDRLVEHVFVFEGDGEVKTFPGNYTDYREYLAEQETEKNQIKPAPAPTTQANNQPEANKKKKASFSEKREFEQLDSEIAELENQKAALLQEMNSGNADHRKITEAAALLKKVESELDAKTERWLELSELMD
ncbi:ABC-F family ATP-binding cassette domain-containing protein [Adhaeribacter rhizoryzae]|uniref:ABC-F family ATP-binding cassette domain-containing protein n=1 Tax=Adhaeribacter rhizoryzae TaxID=2607907 RepID=A0A5M6DIW8_9BACT|nr:ABC-F family ATP-binding cassette domain-containing protein [Adhaeribacter rhizoryzae]KAA5547403.1 ABC-F family ATP-binding cassette domain-containing protein [Adhaeribacter rhizoryzae]